MANSGKRPPRDVRDPFVPNPLPRRGMRRFSCPCGCGYNRWFTQPRSLRIVPPRARLTAGHDV